MDWFKIYAEFWAHPKFIGLSDRAFRVVTSSWGYAAKYATDGHVPAHALRLLHGRTADADELVAAGLWHLNGDGWVIHDWADWQVTRDEVESKRAKWKEKKARQRLRRAQGESP